MNATSSCRDRGRGGVDVGALCLSSCGCYLFASGNLDESGGPDEDRHKAPTLPRIHSLSLQNRRCIKCSLHRSRTTALRMTGEHVTIILRSPYKVYDCIPAKTTAGGSHSYKKGRRW